jgi:hypothetical protein
VLGKLLHCRQFFAAISRWQNPDAVFCHATTFLRKCMFIPNIVVCSENPFSKRDNPRSQSFVRVKACCLGPVSNRSPLKPDTATWRPRVRHLRWKCFAKMGAPSGFLRVFEPSVMISVLSALLAWSKTSRNPRCCVSTAAGAEACSSGSARSRNRTRDQYSGSIHRRQSTLSEGHVRRIDVISGARVQSSPSRIALI